MKKRWRILTLCMVLVMLCGMLPFAASAAQADTIALDEVKSVNITEQDGYVDFYFTPTVSGKYAFESFDESDDPYGYIFEGEDEVDYNDDGGEAMNFRVTAELTAGVQYTLRARGYNGNVCSMKVTIYKMVAPTAVEGFGEKSNLQIHVGTYMNFEPSFYPKKSYEVDVIYTSSNEEVIAVEDDEYYAIAPGTTTLSAVTENGLKDSIKVTVMPTVPIKVGDTFKISLAGRTLPTYAFKAPADGEYVFYVKTLDDRGGSSANCFAYLPESDRNVIDYRYIDRHELCYMNLKKNDLVYIVMRGYFSSDVVEVGLRLGDINGGIKASANEYVGYIGDYIYPSIEPARVNALVDFENVTYTSDDETVVAVEEGDLHLLKPGAATITATNDQGKSCTFTVRCIEIPRLTTFGPHKFSPTVSQEQFLYCFTPTKSDDYFLEIHNPNDSGVSIDAYQNADGTYPLTAGETYLIEAGGYLGGTYSFSITTEAPEYVEPCAPDQHDWVTVGFYAPTTITPGERYEVCSKCNDFNWEETKKLTVKKDVTKQFTDIKKKDWFYDEVNFAYNSNLFAGTSATKFSPNDKMTRAMFVTVLGRLSGVEVNNKVATKFTDVKKNQYYTGYVAWANKVGIVNGISATTFEPNSNVTREQICVMMEKFLTHVGMPMRTDTPAVNFKDANKISKWAKKSVAACQQGGIINGIKSGNGYVFNPQGNATRAEVATIVYNYVRNYIYMLNYEYYENSGMM